MVSLDDGVGTSGVYSELGKFSARRWYGKELEWLRLRHSILVISSYLDASVPERVLDLAAGEGIRAFELARIGSEVVGPGWSVFAGVSSKSGHIIEPLDPAQAPMHGKPSHIVDLDPTVLAGLGDNTFSLVIADGPFYRGIVDQDRLEIGRQIERALKPGGHLVAMFRMWPGEAVARLIKPDANLSTESIRQIYQLGDADDTTSEPPNSQSQHRYTTCADAIKLLEAVGFQIVEQVASEGIGALISEGTWKRVRELGDVALNLLFNMIWDLAEDPSTIGLSPETIVVARKRA